MRWFWIDRFTQLVSGQHATAIKNVTLSEEHIHDHFPGHPVMPHSLIVEGMAQTAGLLVGQYHQFQTRVILAKLSKIRFHFPAVPGDTLTYHAKIEQINEDGAMATTTSHVGDRLQAEAEMFFAHLADRVSAEELFDPAEFLAWLKLVRLFDVGVTAEGQPIEVPAGLATQAGFN